MDHNKTKWTGAEHKRENMEWSEMGWVGMGQVVPDKRKQKKKKNSGQQMNWNSGFSTLTAHRNHLGSF